MDIKEAYYQCHSYMLNGVSSDPDDVFYAHALSLLRFQESKDKQFPAGVSFKDGQYYLSIGDSFITDFTLKQRAFILKHEVLHVLLKHIARKKNRDHLRFNIATDLSINPLIDKDGKKFMDGKGCFPQDFKLEPMQSAEVYYVLLKDNKKFKELESGQGNRKVILDDHGEWELAPGEGTEELTAEEMESLAEEIAEAISEKAMQKSKGNISASLNEAITLAKRKKIVDWKRILKKSIGRRDSGKKGTYKRKNRRFIDRTDIKGHRKAYSNNTIIGCDVSGSMSSTEDIGSGLSEVLHLCKVMNSNPLVFQIDTEIKKVSRANRNMKTFDRSGCGGTEMYPFFKHIKENKIPCDTAVLITDGMIESSFPDYDFPFQIVILVTGNNKLTLNTKQFPNCKVFNLG